jgi:ectoine hydroxylase-related dioxygenase (phytanoyl-CoA dioxygenase family)
VFAVTKNRAHYFRAGNLLEHALEIAAIATDPRLVDLAEDAVGGPVIIEETEAIINSRDPAVTDEALRAVWPNGPHSLHRAIDPEWGCYWRGVRLRHLYVKAIINLTDLGAGDGGTVLIPGSHRVHWPAAEIVAAAKEDPSLFHCIEAPAGSVLFFTECLVHGTSLITTDRERVTLAVGYIAPMFRMEDGNAVSPDLVARLPEDRRRLVLGGWSHPPHDDNQDLNF